MKRFFSIFVLVVLLSLPLSAAEKSNDPNPLFPVSVNGKYGYINKTGKVIIKPQFEKAMNFSEGLAAVVEDNGHWSYINKSGKIVFTPIVLCDWAGEFSGGLAQIRLATFYGSSYQTIDSTGADAFDRTLHPGASFGKFSHGLAAGGKYSHKYYINKKGSKVFNKEFYDAGDFSEGLAMVAIWDKSQKKYGFIDTTGTMVIQAEYDEAGSFSLNRAWIKIKQSKPVWIY
ncbi:MAG: WG repeat-containing protein [Candidatus Latescibacteria bacterium]|nr:WG repeat-containing protein [Candidatus Latescibacterota bacterium]